MMDDSSSGHKQGSIEDLLKRSVFAKCLRLLSQPSQASQRHVWHSMILDIRQAKAALGQGRGTKRPRPAENDALPSPPPDATSAAVAATGLPASSSRPDLVSAVAPADASQSMSFEDVAACARPSSVTTAAAAAATSAPSQQQDPSLATAAPTVNDADASASIGQFLREQLDLAMGLSLQVLTAPALHLFCTMLGCVPGRSKSKEALFNALLNFYFTHAEPVGKRVSTNTFAEQEQAAMNSALLAMKPKPKPAAAAPAAAPTTASTVVAPKTLPPLPRPKAVAAKSTTKHAPLLGDGEDLVDADVDVARTSIFAHRAKQTTTATDTSPPRASTGKASGASPEQLLRDITTIIRCFDPITLDSLCHKVAQLGTYPAVSRRVVQQCVDDLTARHVCFVDCGVVFFEGS